jgi:hypothetical protein
VVNTYHPVIAHRVSQGADEAVEQVDLGLERDGGKAGDGEGGMKNAWRNRMRVTTGLGVIETSILGSWKKKRAPE